MPSPVSILRAWYKRNKRSLPWRGTRDPYKILVSEIMLQQTQVDRVKDFYVRWMKQFPTWTELAEARTDELLHAWAGLGYNRRALMLREAARQVVKEGIPKTIETWKTLRGVGPYTAAAVYGFSQHKRTIAVDTNVRRVAGRVFLGMPYPAITDDPRVIHALEKNVPKRHDYWEFPQLLMDFGTAVCTQKNPACATCPLRTVCRAAPKFLQGIAGKKPRTISRERKHDEKPHPDRIYRGRILATVRTKKARTISMLGPLIDPSFNIHDDDAWIRAMVSRLAKDGMIATSGERIFLPKK